MDRGIQAILFHSASGVFNEDIVGADEEDANSRGTKYPLACVGVVDSMSIKSVIDWIRDETKRSSKTSQIVSDSLLFCFLFFFFVPKQ